MRGQVPYIDCRTRRGSYRGLSPPISIEQKTTAKPALDRPEQWDRDLRLYAPVVYARVARAPYSPASGLPIEAQQVRIWSTASMTMPEDTRAYLLAPIVRRDRKANTARILEYASRGSRRVKGGRHSLN